MLIRHMAHGKWRGVFVGGAVLLSAAVAGAQELTLLANLGVRGVNGENESWRFNEYRDLSDGVAANFLAGYDSDTYFTQFKAFDIGLRDQYYDVTGGAYAKWKYTILFNHIPHALSLNDITWYTAVKVPALDYTLPNASLTNTALWPTGFNYDQHNKDLGGRFELTQYDPFYVLLSADRITTYGVKAVGVNGSSPGGAAYEIPMNVDYQNNMASIEAGYRQDMVLASLRYSISAFNNFTPYQQFRNPYYTKTSPLDRTSVAPHSLYQKWNANLSFSKLPMDSVFSIRGDISTLKNDFLLDPNTFTTTGTGTGTTTATATPIVMSAADGTYHGDIAYRSAAFTLASNPAQGLDSRLFYSYLQKANDSSEITFGTGATAVTNELFNYHKNDAGLNLGYRLPYRTRLSAGFEWLEIVRNRLDAVNTIDRIYSAGIRNSYLDWLTGWLKYSHVARTSNFTLANDPNYFNRSLRRYDVTDKDEDAFRVGVDVSPVERLDFGAEYIYRRNHYHASVLGRLQDSTQGGNVNAAYELKSGTRLHAFYDVERVVNWSRHKALSFAGGGNAADPTAIYTGTTYRYVWDAGTDDYTWSYGLGTDVPVIKDKIDLHAAFEQTVSNGYYALNTQIPTGANGDTSAWDDYRRSTFNLKGTYHVNPNLSASIGFLWEHLKYSDAQYDGYKYVANTPATAQQLLTGAYKDNSYLARVFYVEGTYRF